MEVSALHHAFPAADHQDEAMKQMDEIVAARFCGRNKPVMRTQTGRARKPYKVSVFTNFPGTLSAFL